jgi:hypothetical protein
MKTVPQEKRPATGGSAAPPISPMPDPLFRSGSRRRFNAVETPIREAEEEEEASARYRSFLLPV